MRTRQLVAVLAAAGVLTACGGTDDAGGNTGGGNDTGGATDGGSGGESESTDEGTRVAEEGPSSAAFADALAMVGDGSDTSTSDMPAFLEFVDQARINELTADNGSWRDIGADPSWRVDSYLPMPLTVMRLNLEGADTVLTVGNMELPTVDSLQLLNGGQDVPDIEALADDDSWEGELPLLRYVGTQPNMDDGMQLLVRGEDSAASGYRDTDMSVVDAEGPTLADQERIRNFRDCLGDAVRISATSNSAVGVVPAEGGTYSVVCSLHPDRESAEEVGRRAVDTVDTEDIEDVKRSVFDPYAGDLVGQPYSDYFGSAEVSVEELDDAPTDTGQVMLRTVLPHTEAAPPGIVFMLADDSVPGVTQP